WASGARKSELLWALGGVCSALPAPVAVLIWGDAVYSVADPFMWALHDRYILEFQSMATYLSAQPGWLKSAARCLPFALIGVAALSFRRAGSQEKRLALALALAPAVALAALALYQVRWWGEAAA